MTRARSPGTIDTVVRRIDVASAFAQAEAVSPPLPRGARDAAHIAKTVRRAPVEPRFASTVRRRVEGASAADEDGIDVDLDGVFDPEEAPTRSPVRTLVPLDMVPKLAVDASRVPWADLGELARTLLGRVDGKTPAMVLVSRGPATPYEGARELAALVKRGLLHLQPATPDAGEELELDLAAV